MGDETQAGRTLHKLALVEDKYEEQSHTRREMGEAVLVFSRVGLVFMLITFTTMVTRVARGGSDSGWLDVSLTITSNQ